MFYIKEHAFTQPEYVIKLVYDPKVVVVEEQVKHSSNVVTFKTLVNLKIKSIT